MTRRAQRRVLGRALVTLFAGVMVMLAAMTGVVDAAKAASGASSWTVYHGNVAGSGVSIALQAVNTKKRAWSSPALQGQLYGEPLVFGGSPLCRHARQSCLRTFVIERFDSLGSTPRASGALVESAV